jgi:hypothetical protein
MLKKHELATPTSCLNKAASDEPVFVLRAKDKHAPQTLRLWATMAEDFHEPEKIAEARKLADEMEKWRAREVAEIVAEVVPPLSGYHTHSSPRS